MDPVYEEKWVRDHYFIEQRMRHIENSLAQLEHTIHPNSRLIRCLNRFSQYQETVDAIHELQDLLDEALERAHFIHNTYLE
jgi:hypothetical protein